MKRLFPLLLLAVAASASWAATNTLKISFAYTPTAKTWMDGHSATPATVSGDLISSANAFLAASGLGSTDAFSSAGATAYSCCSSTQVLSTVPDYYAAARYDIPLAKIERTAGADITVLFVETGTGGIYAPVWQGGIGGSDAAFDFADRANSSVLVMDVSLAYGNQPAFFKNLALMLDLRHQRTGGTDPDNGGAEGHGWTKAYPGDETTCEVVKTIEAGNVNAVYQNSCNGWGVEGGTLPSLIPFTCNSQLWCTARATVQVGPSMSYPWSGPWTGVLYSSGSDLRCLTKGFQVGFATTANNDLMGAGNAGISTFACNNITQLDTLSRYAIYRGDVTGDSSNDSVHRIGTTFPIKVTRRNIDRVNLIEAGVIQNIQIK